MPSHDFAVVERLATLPLTTGSDVVRARHGVREQAVHLGMDLVTQTKVVTAASELGRNVVVHGGGGELELSRVRQADSIPDRIGLQLVFRDHGPGIVDLNLAMTGGYSTGRGLGLGLPGSRRLVHDFDIQTGDGAGTTITAVMWPRLP